MPYMLACYMGLGDIKDRQGVSVRDQMYTQPFDNTDVICTAIICIK